MAPSASTSWQESSSSGPRSGAAGTSRLMSRESVDAKNTGLSDPILDRLAPGSRILDGGCGMGEWTVFLAQRGFILVGADISEHTVERLRGWFPYLEFV